MKNNFTHKCVNRFLLIFFLFIAISESYGITRTAQIAGVRNWSDANAWNPIGVPVVGDVIVINPGCSITVDMNTAVVGNITVNGVLQTIPTGSSNLSYSGDMIVTGSLLNDGGIEQTTLSGKNFNLNGTATYKHNPKNNTSLDESIFSRSNENFQPGSNLIIQKWFDLTIPLGSTSRVQTSIFGNVTLAISDTLSWEQEGGFMFSNLTQRVFGKFTVSSGVVSMDNGAAGYPQLLLNDVVINGTGSVIFQSGLDRPLDINTGNFTDTSTSLRPTILSDSCFSFISWTVNGSCIISHNFYGIRGSGNEPGGNLFMTVNSHLTIGGNNQPIGGGNISFIRKCEAPFYLSVVGWTTIQGSPSSVRFIEGNDGDFTFSTYNLIISGGANNVFLGASSGVAPYTGQPLVTIQNDFLINGTSNTTFMSSDSTTKKLSLVAGRDFIMSGSGSVFTAADTRGAVTFRTVNNMTLTNGRFTCQINTNSAGIDSIVAGANFLYNSPTATDFFRGNSGTGPTVFRCLGSFTMTNSGTAVGQGVSMIYRGTGNLNFYVAGTYLQSAGRVCGIYNDLVGVETGSLTMQTVGAFTMNGGAFRGIDNRYEGNGGVMTFNTAAFTFNGGNFKGHYSANSNNGIGAFTIGGNCVINYTAATDSFAFLGWTTIGPVTNQMILNLTVNGDFKLGNFLFPNIGVFISSVSNGIENIQINGNDTINGGALNSFNSYPNISLANSHKVNMNITGNMVVRGGTTYLSANNDTLSATVLGNLRMLGGDLAVQGGSVYGNLRIKGEYYQQGGIFYLHRNVVNPSYQRVLVEVNYDDDVTGIFTQTNGIINFDDNVNSTQNIMNVKSPSITFIDGDITMASPGTNTIAGIFQVARNGIVNFSRFTNAHNIQQVQFHIKPGCTMNLGLTSTELQIASFFFSSIDWLVVDYGAVLDLRAQQIKSNLLQPNSGMLIYGRLRIKHPGGLYNNTTNAAINANGGMNYFLLPNSTVEYYGDTNQVVTGIGVGLATFGLHKYYNLEINFTGTPDVEYVYPTNIPDSRSVRVTNKLILTAGELNLDNDHNNASGGRSIVIERDSTTAITRTNGYIRSEVIDSSASVIWLVKSMPGAHVIPFGYSSGPANYIPFTFNLPSGNADTVIVSTYHTPVNNLPLPPSVAHLNDLSGANNSALTVDRFWYIKSTGTPPQASLTFTHLTSETAAGISNPRAQRWLPFYWEMPYQGSQSNPLVNTTQVLNATGFSENWWALASITSPLPVTLVDFTGVCSGKNVDLTWTTLSEVNNDYFSLLRSNDGKNYEEITRIDGAGNTTSLIKYVYTDRDFNGPLAFYKLIQTDFDGKQSEYGPVAVKSCDPVSAVDVTVIASQSNQSEILLNSPYAGDFKITLLTVDGKILGSGIVSVVEGNNSFRFDHAAISSAVYIFRLESSKDIISKKVVLGM